MRFLLMFTCIFVSLLSVSQTQKPISVDAFLSKPFGVEENVQQLAHLDGINFKVKKEAVPNLHDPAVVDTIYHFKKGKNTIKLFKGKHNSFVYEATIKSKKIKLAGGIHPRMSRTDFYQSLKGLKDSSSDTQILENTEKTAKATAYFKRNKLKQIKLEYNVD